MALLRIALVRAGWVVVGAESLMSIDMLGLRNLLGGRGLLQLRKFVHALELGLCHGLDGQGLCLANHRPAMELICNWLEVSVALSNLETFNSVAARLIQTLSILILMNIFGGVKGGRRV